VKAVTQSGLQRNALAILRDPDFDCLAANTAAGAVICRGPVTSPAGNGASTAWVLADQKAVGPDRGTLASPNTAMDQRGAIANAISSRKENRAPCRA